LLYSYLTYLTYLIVKTDFVFPKGTNFPSIACFGDENCSVYTLSGSAVLTGAEDLLAKNQGCIFDISDIIYIPFNFIHSLRGSESWIKPFEVILRLKKVQEQRREHKKGTIGNLRYKEIGKSIYGSVLRGISEKQKFDTRTK
jgi:hypothetical protein